MKRIIVISVFSSFLVGKVCGQNPPCDTLKDARWEGKAVLDPYVHQGDFPTVDLPTPPDPNEVRRIYFIHGLGGGKRSWSKAAEACQDSSLKISGFPARKCEAIRNDYVSSTSSLYLAADDVRTAISGQANDDRDAGLLDPSRAILIGHSQGGLVIRQLMHLDMVQETNHSSLHAGMNYGGVVTIASPLQGAQILNNRHLILQMAQDASNRLLPAVIYDELPSMLLPFLTNKLETLMEKASGFAANTALPMFFNDYYAGITNSYQVGATHINTLNSDTNNTTYRKFPKMAFYAIEPQENLLWRTFNWIAKEPNDEGHFQANDDWDLLDNTVLNLIYDFQSKRMTHYAEWQRYQDLFWSTCWIPLAGLFTGPIYYAKATGEKEKYLAFTNGLEWFNYANDNWKRVIGAYQDKWHKPAGVLMHYDNDGIVLAESAAELPSATHPPVKIYPNENSSSDIRKGSSHMQVRNDEGLRIHLKTLFDGNYHPYFKIFPKE